jgi:octaprenyl-diphosphate synthase
VISQKAIGMKEVFDAYNHELQLVKDRLKELFLNDIPLITLIGEYLLESGGKKMRPLFLLASARLSGYKGKEHIGLAAVIELIHMASLLHDDVVDGAQIRRGRPVANSIWGNQAVILVGDFLCSKALRESVSFKRQGVIETLSDAAAHMTEGEIFQLQKTADISITEDEYIKIISSKTGSLISAACRIGAILAESSVERENAFADFGMKAGTGFQMADDILDYMADENELGKKLGKDIEEGKITLPLIYLFENASDIEKKEIKGIIENFSEQGMDNILEMFGRYDVLDKSLQKSHDIINAAKKKLVMFPDSCERDYMSAIADYAVNREK